MIDFAKQPQEDYRFAMIPYDVITMEGITPPAMKLYVWYKMICGESEEGRCWQSLATIAKGCGMNRHTIIRARKKLEELGLIMIERASEGRTAMQHIAIVHPSNLARKAPNSDTNLARKAPNSDTNLARKAPSTRRAKRQALGAQSAYNKSKFNKSKDNKRVGRQAAPPTRTGFSLLAGGDTKQEELTPAQKYGRRATKELHKALVGGRKLIGRPKPKLHNWRQQFSVFFEAEWDQRNQIKKVLLWYCNNLGGQFTPIAYAANTFIAKFVQIEDAMHRARQEELAASGEDIVDEFDRESDLVRAYSHHNPELFDYFTDSVPAKAILLEFKVRWESVGCPWAPEAGIVPPLDSNMVIEPDLV